MNSSVLVTDGCGFAGNSDIYGLGIRLGYYAQILAIYLSNFLVLSEAKVLRASNALFLLALSIVTVIYAYNAASTHAIEVFILLQMGLCLAIVSILEGTRYSSRFVRLDKERLVVRTVLANFGIFYNLYFWWWGLDSMTGTPCGTYVFYFVRADIYGPMRTAMKVFAITGGVWRTLFITTWDVGMVMRDLSLRKLRASFVERTQQRWRGNQTKDVVHCHDCKARTEVVEDRRPIGRRMRPGSEMCSTTAEKENHPGLQPSGQPMHNIDVQKVSAAPSTATIISTSAALSFEAILEAEKYLNEVFMKTSSLPEATFTTAIERTLKASFADVETRHIKDTLATHSKALSLGIRKWPLTVNRMLELNTRQGSRVPRWQTLTVASDIQLKQMPVIKPLWAWLWLAAQNFLIMILLIVQIELTISWNGIYGLAGITTVGQLFPLCLGIGGLVKVLWSKGLYLWKGRRSAEHKEETKRPNDYEIAMDKYLEWKERRNSVSVHESSTGQTEAMFG